MQKQVHPDEKHELVIGSFPHPPELYCDSHYTYIAQSPQPFLIHIQSETEREEAIKNLKKWNYSLMGFHIEYGPVKSND